MQILLMVLQKVFVLFIYSFIFILSWEDCCVLGEFIGWVKVGQCRRKRLTVKKMTVKKSFCVFAFRTFAAWMKDSVYFERFSKTKICSLCVKTLRASHYIQMRLEFLVPERKLPVHTHLWRGGSAAWLAVAQLQMGELCWKTRFFKAGLEWRQHFCGWTAGRQDEDKEVKISVTGLNSRWQCHTYHDQWFGLKGE